MNSTANYLKQIFSVLVIVSFLAVPSALQAQMVPVLPDGTLVKAVGDGTIYYLEFGKRRPIDSGETFRLQGFQWVISEISAGELAAYPLGGIITKDSTLVFPGQNEIAPDLAPFAARDLQLANRNGRWLLLFTAVFWNRGRGPLELNATGNIINQDNIETAQRLVLPGSLVRNKVVGNLFWHGIHNHFHYDDFAAYVLEMVAPPVADPSNISSVLGEVTTAPETRNKATFCIYENETINLPTDGQKIPNKLYTSCGKFRQGISVGWADKYDYTLPDQNFDVTDMPAGIYQLSFVLDPQALFVEGNQANNTSVALIDLNPAAGAMTVLGYGSPFASPANHLPNGMLVRGDKDPAVYVIRNDKKQKLSGKPSGRVYELPQGVVDAIPRLSLVMAAGTPTIYLLNENGFRRGITTMEVFNSYGLNLQDVTALSQSELANYPETDLVNLVGYSEVYSISERRSVGTYESLSNAGYDPASVHYINQTDFGTYMVEEIATGLYVPWDIVFLPGGDMLVPERSGNLRRIGSNPAVYPIPNVQSSGEGGLMGVTLHPQFAQNNYLYVYYTTSENGPKNRVSRFRLNGSQLTDQTVIIDNIPSAIYHDGGRIAFGPDGMLYITTGDANQASLAQDLNSLAGKTLRLTADGQIPTDNPYGSAVWSYGHRNSQGIAWDSWGRMWQTEHGRSGASTGFDELNLIERGKNYGWPIIQGDETGAGMVTPLINSGANYTWAPAGIAFVNGSLYFGGLRGSELYQVRFNTDGSFLDFRSHFAGKFGRLRAVTADSDGALYISTSNVDGRGTPHQGDDKILKIHPGYIQSSR